MVKINKKDAHSYSITEMQFSRQFKSSSEQLSEAPCRQDSVL